MTSLAPVGQRALNAAPQDPDVSTLMKSPAFVVIVFVATLTLVLSNALVAVLDASASWTHTLTPVVVMLLIVLGCAAQSTCLLLIARRPVLAALGTVVSYLAVVVLVAVPTWTAAMQLVVAIALFALATRVRRSTSIGWLAASIIATVSTLTAWAASTGATAGVVWGFVINQGLAFAAPAVAASALGMLWASHARSATSAREHAERVSREQEQRMAETRDVERARIAQELHDVAGQHIAGLVSLCDASVELAPQHPDRALQLIDEVRAEGRFAAAALYGALGDLRAVDARSIAVTPDLRDLDQLIDFWARRSMTVTLKTLGALQDLPAVVSTIAYRGLQEALSNAAKHAPGAVVEVDITVFADRVRVRVANSGALAGRRREEPLGLGWGLDGLRTKLLLVDGTLYAGPDERGGWVTLLDIPLPSLEGGSRVQGQEANPRDDRRRQPFLSAGGSTTTRAS